MPLPVRLTHFALEQVPSFSAFLPYLAYEPEHKLYLLSKDGDASHLAWGIVFECLPHPGPGDKQALNLKGLFEILWPPGSTIQVSAAGFMTESIPLLQDYRRHRHAGAYRDLAEQRVGRLAELLLSGQQTLQTAPLRNVTILVSLSIPIGSTSAQTLRRVHHLMLAAAGMHPVSQCDAILQAIPQATRLFTDVQQLLTQAELAPRRMQPERLLTLLRAMLNPGHACRPVAQIENERELRRQVLMADTQVIPLPEGAEIDGYHYRSITPLNLPPEFSVDQMITMAGDLVNTTQQIPTSYLLTLNAVTYDRADAARRLHRKFAIITQQAVGPMARIIPRLGVKQEQFSFTMRAIEHGHIPISAYVHATLWAPSVAEADLAAASTEALWRAHNFTPQRDGPASLNLIRESLPLALSTNPDYLESSLSRARTVLSSNCASLSPIAGDWKGTGRPILLLLSRRGQPCGIDLFNNPTGNYNCVIAGKSGGGKSFLTNDLLLGLLGAGAQVWIIDKGRSYEKLVTTLKGDYLRFTAGAPICLNPFTFVDTGEDFDDWLPRLKALVSQMASPSAPADDLQDAVIGQAIKECYDRSHTNTTITEIAEWLRNHEDPRSHDLAQMLYPYTAHGEFARFFEGPATIDLMHSHLLLLELEELSTKPKLQTVVFLCLVLAVQAAMEKGDRAMEKVVAIDEAWQFLQSPQAAQFVVEIYRRFRKYNGAAITITQEVNDLFGTEAGAAILANSDMRVIFPHKAESLRDQRLAFTPYEVMLIRSLTKVSGKYAECYVQHTTGGGVYRHVVDPLSYWMYTTEPNEVAVIERIVRESGCSMYDAIHMQAAQASQGNGTSHVPAHLAGALVDDHSR